MEQWLSSDQLCLAILAFLVEKEGFVDLKDVEKHKGVVRHLGSRVDRYELILRSGFNRLRARNLVEKDDNGHKYKISPSGLEMHGRIVSA